MASSCFSPNNQALPSERGTGFGKGNLIEDFSVLYWLLGHCENDQSIPIEYITSTHFSAEIHRAQRRSVPDGDTQTFWLSITNYQFSPVACSFLGIPNPLPFC
jgi:hypothetical protein